MIIIEGSVCTSLFVFYCLEVIDLRSRVLDYVQST